MFDAKVSPQRSAHQRSSVCGCGCLLCAPRRTRGLHLRRSQAARGPTRLGTAGPGPAPQACFWGCDPRGWPVLCISPLHLRSPVTSALGLRASVCQLASVLPPLCSRHPSGDRRARSKCHTRDAPRLSLDLSQLARGALGAPCRRPGDLEIIGLSGGQTEAALV
jgi:hypothetical protein